MLKSFTALVAFLCLGPPSLPSAPPAAPKPGTQGMAAASASQVLGDHTTGQAPGAKPVPRRPAAGAIIRPLAKLRPGLTAKIGLLIKKYAQRHGVDEKLIRAVLWQESGGNSLAVSPKGALGLMQLMPETAELMGVRNAFDPEDNLAGGVKYLKLCLERFQQDVALALAAYNAGPEAVRRYGGCPPYRETEDYVSRVMQIYLEKRWTQNTTAAPAPDPSPAKKGLYWHLPGPTWKVPKTKVKVPAPTWKICRSPSKLTLIVPQGKTTSDRNKYTFRFRDKSW